MPASLRSFIIFLFFMAAQENFSSAVHPVETLDVLPVDQETLAVPCVATTVDGTCFGHELKKKHFLLADGFTNLNHGSFGIPSSFGLNINIIYILFLSSLYFCGFAFD